MKLAGSIPARAPGLALRQQGCRVVSLKACKPALKAMQEDSMGWHGTTKAIPLPPVVSWFVTPSCNYKCKFCFATFEDFDHKETIHNRAALLKVPGLLRQAGASRITFVGGEPFLHPLIDELIKEAKSQGLITLAVTNGSCLTPSRLESLAPHLDWLAFSVDASSEDMHAKMGRGLPHEVVPLTAGNQQQQLLHVQNGHLDRVLELWAVAQKLGIRLKLNTVVCKANLDDTGMAALVVKLEAKA